MENNLTKEIMTGETRAISPILPTSIHQGSGSGSYSFRITLSGIYTWTLATTSTWIRLSATQGQGTATVNCTLTAWSGSAAWRAGEIVFVYTSPSETKRIAIPVTQCTLFWPVSGSQYMAGVTRTVEDKGNTEYPAKGSVINGFGAISSFYGARLTASNSVFFRHWAIDIDIPNDGETSENFKALAALSGKIVEIGRNHTVNGNYVYLEHTVTSADNSTKTLYTRYLHLKEIASGLQNGQFISGGTELGTVGHTGSAGNDSHLHFAVLKKISTTATYYLNPTAYYHGSDDRGVKEGSNLKVHANNPMFILEGNLWKINPSFDPTYKDFTGSSSAFYTKFLNAYRDGQTVAEAKQ